MKKLKQIIQQVKAFPADDPDGLTGLLWQLICYSPKMPVRLQQEQLLNEAEKFSLHVDDDYFAKRKLTFNGFKWGSGKHQILLTHGWGSKAADWADVISALRNLPDTQVIAFDAPGNGRSEGELSNLLLFAGAVKAISLAYGKPGVLIGHSLGAMANIKAVEELAYNPALVASITPLVRLKENFEASMSLAEVGKQAQSAFLESFERLFNKPAAYYNLNERYTFDAGTNHWLAFDHEDAVSPFTYLNEFLSTRPFIRTTAYDCAGHERILKSGEMIEGLVAEVRRVLG
jgi:triacylglycerol esterase/lipase EstA (alpha/beta hydrolase family)